MDETLHAAMLAEEASIFRADADLALEEDDIDNADTFGDMGDVGARAASRIALLFIFFFFLFFLRVRGRSPSAHEAGQEFDFEANATRLQEQLRAEQPWTVRPSASF